MLIKHITPPALSNLNVLKSPNAGRSCDSHFLERKTKAQRDWAPSEYNETSRLKAELFSSHSCPRGPEKMESPCLCWRFSRHPSSAPVRPCSNRVPHLQSPSPLSTAIVFLDFALNIDLMTSCWNASQPPPPPEVGWWLPFTLRKPETQWVESRPQTGADVSLILQPVTSILYRCQLISFWKE